MIDHFIINISYILRSSVHHHLPPGREGRRRASPAADAGARGPGENADGALAVVGAVANGKGMG